MERVGGYRIETDGKKKRHVFESPSENPYAHEGVDIDFETLLQERSRLKKTMPGSPVPRHFTDAINSAVRNENDRERELEGIVREVIDRIKSETAFEETIGWLVSVGELADFDGLLRKEGVKVVRHADFEGMYDFASKTICLKAKPKYGGMGSFLYALGQATLPNQVTSYVHERVHQRQYENYDRPARELAYWNLTAEYATVAATLTVLAGLLSGEATISIPFAAAILAAKFHADGMMDDELIFREVQAYKTENEAKGRKTLENAQYRHSPMASLVTSIRHSTALRGGGVVDRVIASSQAIDRLISLGFTQRQIGTFLPKIRFDRNGRSPFLDTLIRQAAEKKGLRLEQVDLLTDARNIQKEIDLLKIAHITREVVLSHASDASRDART